MTDDGIDDDAQWLAALAGRDAAGALPQTRREALLLREALALDAERVAAEAAPRAPAAAVRKERLLALARAHAVLPPQPRAPLKPRFGGLPASRWRLPAAAFALVACLVVVAPWLLPSRPDEPTLRGGGGQVVVLVDPQPALRQSDIVDALRAAGAQAGAYQRPGVWGVDADLPEPLTPGMRATLRRLGLPDPTNGALRIEIGTDAPRR